MTVVYDVDPLVVENEVGSGLCGPDEEDASGNGGFANVVDTNNESDV